MSEVKPVLWVNSDDLNNSNFVGINAVKEGHMDLGRYYTIPLVSFDDHERVVAKLRAENEGLRESRNEFYHMAEGRRLANSDLRAERAEALVAELEAENERLNLILGRIVACDGVSVVTIHTDADAFAAAREYLLGAHQ